MSQNVYDILTERGFIEQCTHPEEVRELLGGKDTGPSPFWEAALQWWEIPRANPICVRL